jgi:hypothetical protein
MNSTPLARDRHLKKETTSTEEVWTSSSPKRRFIRDEEDPSIYWCLSTFTLFDASDITALRADGITCEIVQGAKV